jgi:hypothetical protein
MNTKKQGRADGITAARLTLLVCLVPYLVPFTRSTPGC